MTEIERHITNARPTISMLFTLQVEALLNYRNVSKYKTLTSSSACLKMSIHAQFSWGPLGGGEIWLVCLHTQDYKCVHAVLTICATLVNTQRDRQTHIHTDRILISLY